MTPLQTARLYHDESGNEYFVLNDGSVWPWFWFDSNQSAINDIVESSGDGSFLEPLLNKIEKSRG